MKPEPVKDQQSVSASGGKRIGLPEGVELRDCPPHLDARGSLVEVYDPRWNWHPDPMVYAHLTTIRPGVIKGWALHEHHDDRYFPIRGEVEIVLYDERENSATQGVVVRIVLSDRRYQLLSIPAGVWHALRNLGDIESILLNLPTQPYDHANPDKFRLPLDTDRIPFSFESD